MSCHDCVLTRRQFVAQTTLASVAAVLAACGGGGNGGPTGTGGVTNPPPPVTGPVTVTIANHPDLAMNLRPVVVNASIAVVRTSPGNFLAFSRACTHEGTQVNVTANGFSCPNHGSQFSATGLVTVGPAAEPLRQLTVVHNAEAGTLTITP